MRKRLKILLSLFLVFSMLLAISSVSLAQVSDIEGNWAEMQIRDWVEKKLINGLPNGTFKPENPITRAEFSALINRALGFFKKSDFKFNDVSAKEWFAGDISIGKAQGYLMGDGSNAMPNKPISRQEVITILARILKLKPDETAVSKYSDAASIASWAKGNVGAVCKLGYINDYKDNTFKPLQNATRAEVVAILHKAVGTLYNKAGIQELSGGTGNVSGNVSVTKPGITLKNMTINGNLYLTEGIGDGSVTLENVTVTGTTTVSGGGEQGVIILNSSLGNVVVNVPDNSMVGLIAKGSASIGHVDVMSAAKLEEDSLTGKGFGEMLIEIPDGSKVELAGNFDKIDVVSPKAQLFILRGIINDLLVNSKGSGFTLDKSVTINTLTVNQPTKMTGMCVIATAIIHSTDVSIETKPKLIKKDAFLTGVDIGYGAAGGGGGGGGGGPSGGGDPTPTPTPAAGGPTATPSPTPVSTENQKITELYQSTDVEIIDGIDVNEYGLDTTEAMFLFRVQTETDLDKFISLSESGKKEFFNTYVQDNFGIVLGVRSVYCKFIYQGKIYASMDTSYNADINNLNLMVYNDGIDESTLIPTPTPTETPVEVTPTPEILTVIAVQSFSDITVASGADITDLLQTSAEVTLSDGSTRNDFQVTWDTSSYDPNVDGEYIFSGTLTDLSGSDIIIPNDMKASIRLISSLSIIAVDPIVNINVDYGTELATIVFPDSVGVTLSDSTPRSLNVTWNTSTSSPSYNKDVAGTYTFTGTLEVPADVIDPQNYALVSINVVVGEYIITVSSVDTFADKNVLERTPIGEITLPTQVTAVLSDNSTRQLNVVWDNSVYDEDVLGTHSLLGEITIPDDIENPLNVAASIKINVVRPIINPILNTPLKTSRGNEIDECDSLDGWTWTNNVDVALDTEIMASGSASLNISANVAGGPLTSDGYQVMKVFDSPINMSGMNNVEVDVYIPDISQTDRFSIRFYNDENSAWYEDCYMRLFSNWKLVNGWNRISLTRDEFMSDGSPSWSSIRCVRIIFFPREGCKPSVNLDRIAFNVGGRAQILFTFDDGWYDLLDSSITNNAFNILSERGFDATVWAKMSSVAGYRGNHHAPPNNGSLYLNETDLQRLYDAGWDIGNHTVNHFDNLSDLSVDVITQEFEDCQEWLVRNWERGAHFACYPSGVYNERITGILDGIGVLAARTVRYGAQTMPVDNMLKLKTIYVGTTEDTNMAATFRQIDNAINTGSTIIFMLHKIEDSTDPIAMSTADFQDLVDYVYDYRSDLDVVTISEWYEKYTDITRITGIVGTIGDIDAPFGTDFEELQADLPDTIEVTLNNGDTEEVDVEWNAGNYNENASGTYTLYGIITPPSGVTNALNLRTSVNVIVAQQAINSVETIPDITVAFGTEVGLVGLPATVIATLSDGSTEVLDITWTTTPYNPIVAATYELQGTLTLPEGVENPGIIMAHVNVIVASELQITGIQALADITVELGTENEAIITLLPGTVNVMLNDASNQDLAVTWDITPYDGNVSDTYTLTGTLTLPVGIINPGNTSASINVIVAPQVILTISSVQDATVVEVVYGTEAAAIPLPVTVNATLSDGNTQALDVTWVTTTYQMFIPGTYELHGTLTLPDGIENPNDLVAHVSVVVSEAPTP